MHLLVINSGSSSIKFSIFATGETPRSLYEGEVNGIGSGHATFAFHASKEKSEPTPITANNPEEATHRVIEAVFQTGIKIDAAGYRIVHPGPKLAHHTLITAEVLDALDHATIFAPLHDPSAVSILRTTMKRLPKIPHFACFDTVFHRTMPEVASTYAIPDEYRQQGVHRYGFHGLSCESIIEQLRSAHKDIPHCMTIAHLGSGCSVTACLDGCSIDTTMGLTPTGGVVMGTRPGDLDPGLILYLLRDQKGSSARGQNQAEAFAAVEDLFNHSSGIAALSGLPNDMRATREAAAKGNQNAKLAIEVFTRSVRKAIGSYAFLMGGLDAIVFTGGIGEHDALSRAEITTGLENLGIALDPALNNAEYRSTDNDIRCISASQSKTEILVIPAKEDWMIARHVEHMLGSN